MAGTQTLATAVTVEGIGLHTGAPARVTLRPAAGGHGRVFRRDGVEIPALADYVVDTRRCVTLGRDGARVSTVEHLLAACMLAGVDDLMVDVEGPELPILDGAACQWLEAFAQAGVSSSHGELAYYPVTEPRWVGDGDSGILLTPAPVCTLYAVLTVPDTVAENMAVGGPLEACRTEIARARTFGLEREVAALWDAGLAQGGSLDNAVVLTRDGYLNDHVWPQEPAWHKVLDLLGDLALLGRPLVGQVVAIRAGHRLHVELVRQLREALG